MGAAVPILSCSFSLPHAAVEEAKVAIRNGRREAIEDLKEFEKEKMISEDDFYHGREQVQELTDEFVKKLDEVGEHKEKEIREV